MLCLTSVLSSCANAPLRESNSLLSYENLARSDGRLTKAKLRVDAPSIMAAKTIAIVPTTFSADSLPSVKKAEDRQLVTNAIDRAMCIGLSERFVVVTSDRPADLLVHAVVTNIILTNRAAAGLSVAATLGSAVVSPVPLPRLPIGLGGLSVEAQAVGEDGTQKAAMVWARGANSFTNRGRVSAVGDAYSLATTFGNDFSKMLIKGRTPFKGMPSLPSVQKLRSNLGGRPKNAACEVFGRAPGVSGMIAGELGLPPEWTDKRKRTGF